MVLYHVQIKNEPDSKLQSKRQRGNKYIEQDYYYRALFRYSRAINMRIL